MFAAQVACSFRLKYPKLLSDSMGTGKATRLSIYQKVTPTMRSGVKAPRGGGRGAYACRHGTRKPRMIYGLAMASHKGGEEGGGGGGR